MSLPLFSLIIPTYNGAHKIVNLLASIEKQTYRNLEVIVVIDGSADNTREILQKLTFDFPFITIEQENKGRSASRNKGAQAARGSYLMFLDDDVRLLPHGIEFHLTHHQKIKDSILVGGVKEDPSLLKKDIQQYKAYLSQKWIKKDFYGETSLSRETLFITAAHFSLPKEIFNTLGGFDERLNDAEDFDLAIRASMKNIPIYANFNIHVWHDEFISCHSYIKRLREYRKAHAALLYLKPETKLFMANPGKIENYQWKKMIYAIFSNSLWIRIIDLDLLKFFPMKMRFKIYDLVTTAFSVYFPDKKA